MQLHVCKKAWCPLTRWSAVALLRTLHCMLIGAGICSLPACLPDLLLSAMPAAHPPPSSPLLALLICLLSRPWSAGHGLCEPGATGSDPQLWRPHQVCWGQPAGLVRRQQAPSWRLCTGARWQLCAGRCALEADQGIPCQGACAPAPSGAHPATLPACISPPRSEGTNATHHRWGIDRVPTPKEIVEHLDQYVIGQVSSRDLLGNFVGFHSWGCGATSRWSSLVQ